MKLTNIGGYGSISAFVRAKLDRLNSSECSFSTLYGLMFSEKDNVMFEKSEGYRIRKTTYGQSRDSTEKRAGVLSSMLSGAPKNSAVGIYMGNSVDFLECFWAVLRAGFSPLLMNVRLDNETLEKVLAQTNAAAVISDGPAFSVKTVRPDELVSGTPAPLDGAFGEEMFVMSSGTSANVKICAYGAKELSLIVNDSLGIVTGSHLIKEHYEGELKLLTFLPFYHIFGFVAVYLWFAFFSRTFVQLNDMTPQTIVNTIRRHNVTHVFAVPLFWNKVYENAMTTIASRGEKTVKKLQKGLKISRKLENFPALHRAFGKTAFKEIRDNMFGESIKFMISGGSEIRGEVLEFFNAIGYHLVNGYGMTEIGITSVELSENSKIINTCTVGKPLSSVQYSVSGDGELLVRSGSQAKYIIENGVKTERPEWFHTRDLAECKNGRYYILGRRDDLIISESGENLNPNLTEAAIGRIKNVRELCLVGINTEKGKKPLLICSVEKYLDKDALSRAENDIRQRLAELKLNASVTSVFLTEDPLIDGDEIKLNRRLISEKYRRGGYARANAEKAGSSGTKDKLCRRIAEIFANVLGKPAGSMGDDYDFFSDGGGTSLDYFTAVTAIQEEFSVVMPTSSDRSLSRIADISEFIRNSRTQR